MEPTATTSPVNLNAGHTKCEQQGGLASNEKTGNPFDLDCDRVLKENEKFSTDAIKAINSENRTWLLALLGKAERTEKFLAHYEGQRDFVLPPLCIYRGFILWFAASRILSPVQEAQDNQASPVFHRGIIEETEANKSDAFHNLFLNPAVLKLQETMNAIIERAETNSLTNPALAERLASLPSFQLLKSFALQFAKLGINAGHTKCGQKCCVATIN